MYTVRIIKFIVTNELKGGVVYSALVRTPSPARYIDICSVCYVMLQLT